MRLALRVNESLTAAELAKLAKREREARIRGRIEAVRYLRLGHTVPETSKALGMNERQLRNWVHRYNAEGVGGLRDRPRPGQPPHLAPEQVERFQQRVRKGARCEDQVCVLRGKDVQRILQEEFGAKYSLPGVYFLLHRLGLSSLVARPKHQRVDEQAQAAFRTTSRNASKRSRRNIPTRGSRSGSKMKRVSVSKAR